MKRISVVARLVAGTCAALAAGVLAVATLGVTSSGALAKSHATTHDAFTGGYRLAGADGGVYVFGGLSFNGSMGGQKLNQPVVGIASPSTDGYWLVARDGGVFAFGSAQYLGGLGGMKLNKPIVGMANQFGFVSPNQQGYWLVSSDGGVFSFGNAPYLGSLPGLHIAPSAPIVGMASTADGQGYWLVGQDGGVFAFGDAVFPTNFRGLFPRPAPVPGAAPPIPEVVAGVASFGQDNSTFVITTNFNNSYIYQSATTTPAQAITNNGLGIPVGVTTTIAPVSTPGAYITDSFGAVFTIGSASFFGSLPSIGVTPNAAIVGIDGY